MMAFGKDARAELGAFEIVFWRGFVAMLVVFALARGKRLRIVNRKLLLLRTVFGTSTVFFLMMAVERLALTEVSLLDKLQPMAIAILAGLLLGHDERPGARVWLCLVVGFLGCALIIGPDLRLGSAWGLFAVAAAMTAACAQICLRVLARTDTAAPISFFFFLLSIPLAALGALATDGRLPRLPPVELVPNLLGFGVTAAVGQVFLTRAYAEDRAAVVAAASYTGPLWAAIIDALAFRTFPNPLVIFGGALIVGPGLFLLFERRPHRETPKAGIEA